MTSISGVLKRIFQILGLCFAVPGAIFLAMRILPNVGGVFEQLGVSFIILGGAFVVVSTIFKLSEKQHLRRIAELKHIGERYDAEITLVTPNRLTSINGRNPIVVECVYRNSEGRTCLVKSGSVMPCRYGLMGDLRAVVYVNPSDPRDYYVEVTTAEETGRNVQYDNDYR